MIKIRAKSVIKLQTERVRMDYTFSAGASLERVVEELLMNVGSYGGKDAVMVLANKVASQIQPQGN